MSGGHDWCLAAAKVAAAKGLPIDAICVGHIAGELHDPRLAWTRLRGHDPSGAILVRPDRFVGWRAPALADNPAAALSDALDRILAASPHNVADTAQRGWQLSLTGTMMRQALVSRDQSPVAL